VTVDSDVTSFVHLGPTRVRVRTVGAGPPLVMLMGVGGNLDMWEPLQRELPDRQRIMFDFPGTGGSGNSWLPPTMSHNALLTKMLIRKLGYRRVDVLGYSWGGVVAQQLAIQHPGSVRRLILASTTVGIGGISPSPRVVGRMLTPRRYYSRSYFTKIAPTLYGGRYRTDPDIVDEDLARRVGRPPGLYGYACQLAAVMCYSSVLGLPLVSAPTLVLAGDDDPIVPSRNPRLIAALLRHSTLRMLPGAGHLVLFDSPELAAPHIQDFLSAD
jgi:pimeloyl-ACP methyl ester carboxylesterase